MYINGKPKNIKNQIAALKRSKSKTFKNELKCSVYDPQSIIMAVLHLLLT